jgi:hypothetical protein
MLSSPPKDILSGEEPMHIETKCQLQPVTRKQTMRFGCCLALCTFIFALAAGELPAEECGADCSHPEKACLCVVAPGGSRISLTPIGSVERQAAKLGQALEIGDELVNTAEDAIVELACPGGSEVKLHGQFRAVIMPGAEGQDCAFNLLAGGADVLTDKPTQVQGGETVMGSVRTQYSMRVWRTPDNSNVECVVFEGEAEVQNLAARSRRALTSSTKAIWTNGRLVRDVNSVSRRDIETASLLYARTDVARLQSRGMEIADAGVLQASLVRGYAAVMVQPNQAQPRITLAALQTDWRMPKQALYQLTKAEKSEPARQEEKVAIAATKFVAYKQIGREQEAAVESEKVRRMDPATYERLRTLNPAVLKPSATERPRATDPATQRLPTEDSSLQRSRVEEAAVQRPTTSQPSRTVTPGVTQEVRTTEAAGAATQQTTPRPSLRSTTRTRSLLAPIVVEASSQPSNIAVGEWTTITVAATQDGQPLPDAQVIVSAGGGVFRGSKSTQAAGATDANGIFETSWSCQPCAPSYGITAEVSKDGLAAAKAAVTVKIQ